MNTGQQAAHKERSGCLIRMLRAKVAGEHQAFKITQQLDNDIAIGTFQIISGEEQTGLRIVLIQLSDDIGKIIFKGHGQYLIS